MSKADSNILYAFRRLLRWYIKEKAGWSRLNRDELYYPNFISSRNLVQLNTFFEVIFYVELSD